MQRSPSAPLDDKEIHGTEPSGFETLEQRSDLHDGGDLPYSRHRGWIFAACSRSDQRGHGNVGTSTKPGARKSSAVHANRNGYETHGRQDRRPHAGTTAEKSPGSGPAGQDRPSLYGGTAVSKRSTVLRAIDRGEPAGRPSERTLLRLCQTW